MSRLLEVGDYVRVSRGDRASARYFQVIAIEDKIYIQDLSNPEAVSALYHDGKEWRVYGTETRYNLEFIQRSHFLEELPPELIQETALKLGLDDLLNLCTTNQHLNSILCANRSFWYLKYTRDFGETKRGVADWKNEYQLRLSGSVYIFGPIYRPSFPLPILLPMWEIFSVQHLPWIKAKDVSAGRSHLVILDAEGAVWTYGDNRSGQSGSPWDVTRLDNPIRLRLPRIKSIAAGGYHTLVVTADTNEVFSFGSNMYGQLGASAKGSQRYIPAKITLKAQKVSAGENHSLLIDLEGAVWVFGRNSKGQLGIDPVVFPFLISPMKTFDLKAISVSAGGKHSLLLDTEGVVWAFGDNSRGQLGLGDRTSRNTPTKITLSSKAKAISAGYEHSLILDIKGKVWAFGSNENGKLGLGDITDRLVPSQIPDLPKVKAIAADLFYSTILGEDGSVWFSGPRVAQMVADQPPVLYTTPMKLTEIKGSKIDTGEAFIVVVGQSE